MEEYGNSQRHCTFYDVLPLNLVALGRFDAVAAIDGGRSFFVFLICLCLLAMHRLLHIFAKIVASSRLRSNDRFFVLSCGSSFLVCVSFLSHLESLTQVCPRNSHESCY